MKNKILKYIIRVCQQRFYIIFTDNYKIGEMVILLFFSKKKILMRNVHVQKSNDCEVISSI